jgi:glycosyltransferase involved in cell wall biosynthesis
MKILCLIEDLGAGGAQRQLVNLALKLKALGNDVSCLTFFHKDFYLQTIQDAGITYTCIPIKNPLKRIINFRQFIRTGQYDVVIAFLGIPAFLAELAAIPSKKWKLIVGERSANPAILSSTKSRILRLFHLVADHIVANSYTNMKMVRKVNPFLSDKKCHVIYNALDLEKYKPPTDFQFKKENIVRILIAASYRRLKNLMGLIEAVHLLSADEKLRLRIDWYGDRSHNKNPDFILTQAEQRITELNLNAVFTLHPATMQLEEKIQQADVVGLFSYFEGLPNFICEGMACGKPVLTTAVSDLPNLIKDEKNGKLCEPFNSSSITEGIRYFLNTKPEVLERMGQLNRKKATELFDQETVFNEYQKLME